MNVDIKELEDKIGYSFKDKNLLLTAITHSSYAYEHQKEGTSFYERIEFLGDAVLELVSSDFLFFEYPDLPEGKLTRLRASLVCEPTLALCAKDFSLNDYIRLGNGEEKNGGRNRDSIISDVLESVIGAIYLDSGIDEARKFILRFILNDIEHKQLFTDSKTLLQEICQELFGDVPEYELISEEGPDHDKTFEYKASINGEVLSRGKGKSKKAAEQMAAYYALIEVKKKYNWG